jgi:N-acetylglucosaminyldiphosphoundecaprenol N-acetyl-beta-D-mannosaminyltransferase
MVIVGHEAPDVGNDHSQMTIDPALVERLNASGADIIWVGLGAPKQDVWMELYRPVLNATLLVGVGAAFDFIAGTKKQAPQWMQQNGLEWLFRLVSEPRRLWKRYLVYNTLFIYAILQWRIEKMFKQRSAQS